MSKAKPVPMPLDIEPMRGAVSGIPENGDALYNTLYDLEVEAEKAYALAMVGSCAKDIDAEHLGAYFATLVDVCESIKLGVDKLNAMRVSEGAR